MTDGQAFLEYISGSSTNKFEICFSKISRRLDIGAALDAKELSLLYEAALLATLCNITFNGLEGSGGEIKANRELVRTMVEREFMMARDRFLDCPGANRLSSAQKGSIGRIFLRILVTEENLA